METNELRIGNAIMNGAGNIIKISTETIIDIILKYIGANPIPITEEMLTLNLGFKKTEFNKTTYIIHIDNFCIRKIKDDERGKWLIELNPDLINSVSRIALIDFVHELQNIYYDIKKEELIYTAI